MTGVPRFTFEPLGGTTSRGGLGCGSLVGHDSFRTAARLVENALDLGIRYFDTAPLYGMGTAEEVLGAVVGSNPDVVIATKIGIGRPPYSPLKAAVRRYAKPLLDRSRPLKAFARSLFVHVRRGGTAAPAENVLDTAPSSRTGWRPSIRASTSAAGSSTGTMTSTSTGISGSFRRQSSKPATPTQPSHRAPRCLPPPSPVTFRSFFQT